jgi:hypothetical protein
LVYRLTTVAGIACLPKENLGLFGVTDRLRKEVLIWAEDRVEPDV